MNRFTKIIIEFIFYISHIQKMLYDFLIIFVVIVDGYF